MPATSVRSRRTSNSRQRFFRGLSWISRILASVIAVLVLIDNVGVWPPDGGIFVPSRFFWGVVAVALGLAAYFLARCSDEGRQIQAVTKNDRPLCRQLTKNQLEFLQMDHPVPEDSDHPEESRIAAFAQLVLALKGRSQAAREIYTIGDHETIREVTQDYKLFHTLRDVLREAQAVPFPFTTVKKGTMYDQLEVEISTGKHGGITPFEECLRLEIHTLNALFRYAFPGPEDAELLALRMRGAELLAVIGVPTPEQAERFRADVKTRYDDLFPGADEFQKGSLKALVDFVDLYSTVYPICVELPTLDLPSHFSVTYRYSSPPALRTGRSRDSLRFWMNVTPFQFVIPLTLPYLAKSYDLFVVNSTDTYLFTQSIVDKERQTVKSSSIVGKVDSGLPGYFHPRRRAPYHVSHLHIRGLRDTTYEPISSLVVFYEKPFGTLGAAAAVSGVLFLVLLGFAFATLGQGGDREANLLATLLALPTVATVMIGNDISRNHRHASLRARFALYSTIALACAAFAFHYVFGGTAMVTHIAQIKILGFELPAMSLAWQVILVASLALFVRTSLVWVGRARAFFELLEASGLSHTGERFSDGRPARKLEPVG